MTVQEYAKQHNISTRTVYRMIENNEINATKIGNMWQIDCQEGSLVSQLKETITRQEKEIEYLRDQLDKASDDRKRHDMIVMSLSKQIDKQQLMLEDMRNRTIWTKIKTALGFSTVTT